MKKVTFMAAFFALLIGSVSTQVAAQDCGSNWGDSCEWSMCDGKVKVGADWLYWQTQQDNMSYVAADDLSLNGEDIFSADVVEPKYNYTSGYRVNVGYEFPCNCWEANVIYTYMPTSSKGRHVESDENFTVFALSNNGLVSNLKSQENPITSFRQKWDLAINNVDVDIARTITFNECISIRPHAGFRALWYTEKQKVFATGDFSDDNFVIPEDFTNSFAEGQNKFTGYGVEAGLWGSWHIGCGFSIIGHFGGSILYSKFKVKEFITETFEVENEEPAFIAQYASKNNITTATPTMDYFIGLQYGDQLCDLSFAIRAGWEAHVIFDTNRIFGNGNLSAQGLTLGMEVGF